MIELGFVLFLLVIGYSVGQLLEQMHYRDIIEREEAYRDILVIPQKTPPAGSAGESTLVSGNVVISVDYFKRFVAGLRQLVGGRLTTYESLLDRGRREALLRMKEQAMASNASMVFNVKLETASISKGQGNNIGSIEVYAYGTALVSS
ncbi:MAG: heavy metal-binding domain-containing protein [Pseudomonadota bacterium]